MEITKENSKFDEYLKNIQGDLVNMDLLAENASSEEALKVSCLKSLIQYDVTVKCFKRATRIISNNILYNESEPSS